MRMMLRAFIIVAMFATSIQAGDRYTLQMFSRPGCDPCDQFHAAYHSRFDARLRNALNKAFRVAPDIRTDERPDLRDRYNVQKVPTWLLLDSTGREVHRVIGWNTGPDLYRRLLKVPQQPAARAQDSARDDDCRQQLQQLEAKVAALSRQLGDAHGDNDLLQQKLKRATLEAKELREDRVGETCDEKLKRQLDACELDNDTLQTQLEAERQRADRLEQTAARAIAEAEELRSQLTRRTNIDTKTGRPPPVSGNSGRAQHNGNAAGGVGTQPAGGASQPDQSSSQPGVLRRIFRGLVSTGISAGLTAAQSEVASGALALGGPAGLAIGAGLWLLRRRKKKRGGPADEALTSTPEPPDADDFKIENLPLQHIDYTTCWAEHWRNQHADPATALKELELYVQAWLAVRDGKLELPGIDRPAAMFASMQKWVNRQVTDHAQKAMTSENTNHRVFYAHTWKEAVTYIREGTFRKWKPNPPAADAIDDWVAAKLTAQLTADQDQ